MLNKQFYSLLLGGILLFPSVNINAQLFEEQYLDNPGNIPAPVFPVPTERQIKWFETEFYGFTHYGPNTFAGTEWGNTRKPDPTEYAPQSLPDCDGWVQAMQDAGMKGVVVVCKHHDGFCLWPTESTDFNVLRSAGVGPQVDIPGMVSEACAKRGMKFGAYISPWDASNQYYATSKYVTDVFMKQITEICTNYGELFEIWFDGANGGQGYYGGSYLTNKTIDKATYYDWDNLISEIHRMQPNCVVWGRDFRWCGNEDGYSGNTCWSNFDIEEVTIESANNSGIEKGLMFIPSEADVRTTNIWFWTQASEAYTKSSEKLYQVYLESVGRNANLIMNCAPNTAGKLHTSLVNNLRELGNLLKTRLSNDFAAGKNVTAEITRTPGNFSAGNMTDGNKDTYWATNDSEKSGSFTIDLGEVKNIHYVMLQEYIRLGQRVKGFTIETSTDNSSWTTFATGTTIGYKRIMPLNNNTSSYGSGRNARYIKVNITDSKECPLIHTVSVY